MRKINNYRDWREFVDDLFANTNGKYEYFGISSDGEELDGQAEFEREYDSDGFCRDHSFSWEDIVSNRDHMDNLSFYEDILEFIEQDEFYIVDTGSNYNWL